MLAPVVALVVLAAFTPLPPVLREGAAQGSIVITDREALPLREVIGDDGTRARWLSVDDAGPDVARAIVAAEDARFYSHPGIDPFALMRAAGQLALHRRIVSGGSTLTQQLARALVPRPRSFAGKAREMALALRIEASLSKREILEQYENRVSFGPGVRGIEEAARSYFDKSAKSLSLAEAAALASIPRGPSLYDPRKGTEKLLKRRDRVLDRMESHGLATADEVARAKAEPLVIAPKGRGVGAPHLIRGALSGAIDPLAGAMKGRAATVTLTIDRSLQREVEALARETVATLAAKKVTAASVVVIENATGEILAYVGAPNIDDALHLGHNDGVLAKRQPGSSLKPFVYELAMERLGFTAATVLPDVALDLPTPNGTFHPNNYDGHFHGPVRLREALANSLNVPAVWTADAVGPGRIVTRLEELGFGTIDDTGEHYGAAIALGDGEVRLLDLANGYATLARGGVLLPVRAVRAATAPDGKPIALGTSPPKRVLDEATTYVITNILSDWHARVASFGAGSVLELPFPAAAKTGTSKGYRDNIAVGYTPLVTVAVWVGNFDGSPMEGTSGVTGAGPLFHDVMIAAEHRFPSGEFPKPKGVDEVAVCPLSGALPGEHCKDTHREVFARSGDRSTAPVASCTMHVAVAIDPTNGLRAGPACKDAETRVLERYDADLLAWARSAGRPIVPDAFSPRCPGASDEPLRDASRARIAFPPDGAAFSIDPSASAKQAIAIRADVPSGARAVAIVVDGQRHALAPPYELRFPLTVGAHSAHVDVDGHASAPVEFTVD